MFQVEVDKARNLLKIAYAQHVGADDTKRVLEKILALVIELRPGFRLLTDLSGLESMDFDCVPYIERMMDLCDKKGVEAVVRVIPDPHRDIGLNILALFHYQRRVRMVTCKTLEEGMKVLAGKALLPSIVSKHGLEQTVESEAQGGQRIAGD